MVDRRRRPTQTAREPSDAERIARAERKKLAEARQLVRRDSAERAKEQAFERSVTGTLKEAQDAVNIAFGAIISAYIGNVLASVDIKAFNHGSLAFFFMTVTLFIGGLCLGNSSLLKRAFGLGTGLIVFGCVAAVFSLIAAAALGFETIILQICYFTWVGLLLASDAVLTLIIYIHHRDVK